MTWILFYSIVTDGRRLRAAASGLVAGTVSEPGGRTGYTRYSAPGTTLAGNAVSRGREGHRRCLRIQIFEPAATTFLLLYRTPLLTFVNSLKLTPEPPVRFPTLLPPVPAA